MHYDPMIAKLVVWGENWVVALVKMKDCLSKFQVYLNLVSCLHRTIKRAHNVLLGALHIYPWLLYHKLHMMDPLMDISGT